MNPDDATQLDRLHDLVLPPAPPWWPPAPGWLALMIATIAVIAGWLVRGFIRWQADRYRREALALIDSPHTRPADFSALAKRVALSVWPRQEVADLTGREWLEFLDRSGGMQLFVAGPGQALEAAAFDPHVDSDPAGLRAAVREWIVRHRRKEDRP